MRFILFFILAGMLQAAGATSVTLVLQDRVQIDHAHVRVQDLAKVVTAGAAGQRMADVDLGLAPRVGQVMRLSRAELGERITRALAGCDCDLAWQGATAVELRAASKFLPAQTMIEVAKAKLMAQFAADATSLELTLLAPQADLELPLGTVEVKARDVLAPQLSARVPVWVDVLVDGAVVRSVVLPFGLRSQRPVYVARTDLAKGALVTAADFVLQSRDVAGLRASAVGLEALASGARLVQHIGEGQVLTVSQLPVKQTVLRGDRVRLRIGDAHIAVETAALAQGDATVGQTVMVRPVASEQTVAARVVSADLVEIIEK